MYQTHCHEKDIVEGTPARAEPERLVFDPGFRKNRAPFGSLRIEPKRPASHHTTIWRASRPRPQSAAAWLEVAVQGVFLDQAANSGAKRIPTCQGLGLEQPHKLPSQCLGRIERDTSLPTADMVNAAPPPSDQRFLPHEVARQL